MEGPRENARVKIVALSPGFLQAMAHFVSFFIKSEGGAKKFLQIFRTMKFCSEKSGQIRTIEGKGIADVFGEQ